MEEVIFYDSTDNVQLCGILSKANENRKIMIMCHGIRSTKEEKGSFTMLAEYLRKNGYNSFRFDFRGHGESTGEDLDVTVEHLMIDLEKTIEKLKNKGYQEFILLGASFGAGIVSLLDYSKYRNVKAIISWFGALDFNVLKIDNLLSEKNRQIANEKGFCTTISGLGNEFRLCKKLFDEIDSKIPYKNLMKLDIPILLVHGTVDRWIAYQESERIAKLCKNATLTLIEGGDHSFSNSEEAMLSAVEKTINFVKECC